MFSLRFKLRNTIDENLRSSIFVLNFCLTLGIWSYFVSIFTGMLFTGGVIEGEIVEEGDNTSGVQNRAHLSDESSSNSDEEETKC